MAKNSYDDIEFCLNTLYDYYYSSSDDKCYMFNPIIRSEIKLSDLKKGNDFDPTQVLSGNIKFEEKTDNRWIFKRTSDSSYSCNLEIGIYDKKGYSINDMNREELINIAMLYMMSELYSVDKMRHIVLPIMMFDIKKKELDKLAPSIKKEIDEKDEYVDMFVLVTEHYFKMETLESYLKKNGKKMDLQKWKVLFFQLLFTLAKITERFNMFRHNKLDLKSIRIYERKETSKHDEYKIGGMTFSVPNAGFDIKIADFDNAVTSDYSKIKRNNLYNDNPYYDIHYFFNSIYIYLNENNIAISQVDDFINDMVPKQYRSESKNFKGLDEAKFDSKSSFMLTAVMILKKNNFFHDFIDMDLTVSPVDNNRVNKKELKNIEGNIESIGSPISGSPTEAESDDHRLLAKNVNSKDRKKSEQYYRTMIRGSRKIVVPGFNVSENVTSDANIFKKAEKKRRLLGGGDDELKEVNPDVTSVTQGNPTENDGLDIATENLNTEHENLDNLRKLIDGLNGGRRKQRKHKQKGGSKDESESASETVEDKDEKDEFEDSESEKKKSDSESERKEKKEKKEKKDKKSDSESESESSVSLSSVDTETVDSELSGGSKRKSKKKNRLNNIMQHLDKGMRNRIESLPANYINEVPDYLARGFPDFSQFSGSQQMGMQMPSMGMPQMGMPQMGMPPMGMPQEMGMQMPPMGMPQQGVTNSPIGMSSLGVPMMGAPQMMGAPMQVNPMAGQMQMPSMPMGGQVPMMPMTGGGKKYKLKQTKDGKDFFF